HLVPGNCGGKRRGDRAESADDRWGRSALRESRPLLAARSSSSVPTAKARLLAALLVACLAVLIATVAMPAVASGSASAVGRAPGAAAPAAGPRAASPRVPAAERAWIHRELSRMTLEEKVGQLFVINGFGTGLHDKDPRMVKLNREFYGVSNIEELIRKF